MCAALMRVASNKAVLNQRVDGFLESEIIRVLLLMKDESCVFDNGKFTLLSIYKIINLYNVVESVFINLFLDKSYFL